jgi:GAF domain-containing protein
VDHFQSVADDSTVCGRAAASGEQTVVDDIRDDSRFDGHRKALGDPIFRAVQSTPIVDYAGHVVGVISTHFRSASAPPARDLELMERYGQLVAEAAWRVRPSGA